MNRKGKSEERPINHCKLSPFPIAQPSPPPSPACRSPASPGRRPPHPEAILFKISSRSSLRLRASAILREEILSQHLFHRARHLRRQALQRPNHPPSYSQHQKDPRSSSTPLTNTSCSSNPRHFVPHALTTKGHPAFIAWQFMRTQPQLEQVLIANPPRSA